MLAIDENEMTLKTDKETTINATRIVSNDTWFDKLAVDKTIAKAIKHGYNLCFMIHGQKGAGKDYCLTGGVVHKPSSSTSLGDSQPDNLQIIDSLA